MGFVPEQSELLAHCTQPADMMQTGVAPLQAAQLAPHAVGKLHVVQPDAEHFIGSLKPPLSVTLALAVAPATRSFASESAPVELPHRKRSAPLGTRACQLVMGIAQSKK